MKIQWIAIVSILAALAYVLPKVLYIEDGLDFRLIWLSGTLWINGENPYGQEFVSAYLAIFGNGPVSHFWVYPPNWGAISMAFALLPFKSALLLWNLINFTCLVSIAILAPKVLLKNTRHQTLCSVLVFVFLATMQSSALTIAIGQTACIVALAITLVLYGLDHKTPVFLITGLVLVMLKPNIGILVCLMVMLQKTHWRSIFIAGGLSLLLALPVFLSQSPLSVLESFWSNISRYSAIDIIANSPQNLTGLSQLGHYFLGKNFSTGVLLTMACAVIVAFSRLNINDKSLICLALVSTIIIFVPLHSYDFLLIALIIPSLFTLKGHLRWLILAAIVLTWRAQNIASTTRFSNPAGDVFQGSLLLSLAATVIIISSALLVFTYVKERKKNEVLAIDSNINIGVVR